MRRWVISSMLLVALAFPPAVAATTLEPIAPSSTWLSEPLHAASPPGDPRLFVVERSGAVRLVKDGVVQETSFVTVENVNTSGERGLLSIAFPPDYAASGLFYVFTVAAGDDAVDPGVGLLGDLRVVEYQRSASNPDLADPTSARLVLKVVHPNSSIHNGGQIAFGPDGLLYITTGDDGIGSNAQTLANDLGKVLRIDPNDPEGAATFSVPPSNPFTGEVGAKGEIWALGLRNPYRASFDASAGLVVADVGEQTWEEVNAGSLFKANLGWPTCEGACTPPNSSFVDPVFQYPHEPAPPEGSGCAVIGGYVVRDPALAGLTGRYLYGDLCRSDLRTLNLALPGADPKPAGLSLPDPGEGLRSFGEDGLGRVYVLTDENVYRVTPDPIGPQPAADTAPPGLELRAAKQELRSYVELTATCSEDCSLKAGGSLRFPGEGAKSSRSSPLKLSGALLSARAGKSVRLRLKVRKKARRRARKALEEGRRVLARLEVRATDGAGNPTAKRAQLRLTAGKGGSR